MQATRLHSLTSNTYSDWAFASLFGRASYTYSGKYLFSASVRRDGTSRLSEGKRYGIFPSVSVAWRIAEESFMDNLGWLDELKLRASWGQTGNVLSIGTYGTIASLTARNYPMNQQPSQGYTMSSAVNTDLKWESTEKKNLGLDITVFKNSLYLISDFYIQDTYDLLFTQPIPGSTGLTGSPYINAGQIRNTGIEFEVGYRKSVGDWYYKVSANITHSKNEVIDLEGRDLRTEGIVEGYPLRSFFGYKSNGLIRTSDDLNNNPQFSGKKIGDIWLLDVDGPDAEGNLTGEPDGAVNASDRTLIGSPYPDLVYGMMGTVRLQKLDTAGTASGCPGHNKGYQGRNQPGCFELLHNVGYEP